MSKRLVDVTTVRDMVRTLEVVSAWGEYADTLQLDLADLRMGLEHMPAEDIRAPEWPVAVIPPFTVTTDRGEEVDCAGEVFAGLLSVLCGKHGVTPPEFLDLDETTLVHGWRFEPGPEDDELRGKGVRWVVVDTGVLWPRSHGNLPITSVFVVLPLIIQYWRHLPALVIPLSGTLVDPDGRRLELGLEYKDGSEGPTISVILSGL